MEVDAYSSPEQKAKANAEEERIKAHCSGPLCGEADIKEALRYTVNGRPVYSVFVLVTNCLRSFRIGSAIHCWTSRKSW
jgi:hypothetical protein